VPSPADLKTYLDGLVDRYEQPAFIADDPIAIPHGFDDPRDQEVIGLFAALLAWGRRTTIMNKLAELCERMEYQPYAFVRGFDPERDRAALEGFVHRTFQPEDAFWLTHNLSLLLAEHETVERLFARHTTGSDADIKAAIQGFSTSVMQVHPATPQRLQKHLARPAAGSACKRLAMYLRWMVRPGPVDFGFWSAFTPADLVLPLDVHVGRQARALGFIDRQSNDWKAVQTLTSRCRTLDAADPARYDFAFFGVGAYEDSLDVRFTGANAIDFTSLPTLR